MRCPAAFFLRCKPAADRHLCRDTALACSSTHRDENEAADPADGATSPEIWGRGAGIGKIEKGGYVDVAAQHRTTAMSPVSAFSFRPVTIRQLLRCACGDTENGETEIRQRLYDDWTSRSAAHRLGESTIYLDGAPCHRVLICGQVLCREALVGRDSAASHHRYILWWLSDTTGLICVMERSSSTSNSTIEEDEVEDAEIGAVEGQLQQSDPAKSGSFDGETAAAALPAARAEVYDRDYVVCTGRLCFLDVDGDAARVLANQTAALQASLDAVLHPSSKSYRDEKKARGERLSCWVGGSRVNISSATSGGDGAGGSALAVAPVRSEGAEKERPAATPCTLCIRSFSFLPLMQRYGCTTVSSTFISLQIELPLFFAFFAPPLPLPFSFFLSLVLFSLSYLTSLFICLDAVRSGMRRAERRERPDLICPISYYYYLFFLFVF